MTAKIDHERHVDCGFVIPKRFADDAASDRFKIPEKFSNLLSLDSVADVNRKHDDDDDDDVKLSDSEFWLFTWLKSCSKVFPNMSDDAAISIVRAANCDIPIANGFLEKRGNKFSFDSSKMDLNEMAKLAVSAAAFAQSKISVFGPPDFIRLVMKYSEDMQVEIEVLNFTTLAKGDELSHDSDALSFPQMEPVSEEHESYLASSLQVEPDNTIMSSAPVLNGDVYVDNSDYEPVDYSQLVSEHMADEIYMNRAQTRDNFVGADSDADAGWDHDAINSKHPSQSDDELSLFDQLSTENQSQAVSTSFKP